VAEERGARRHRLMVDIAVERLVHSEDEGGHTLAPFDRPQISATALDRSQIQGRWFVSLLAAAKARLLAYLSLSPLYGDPISASRIAS
jgi:hypothetical protein